jgi:anti-sigma factor RsiW
MIGDVHELLPLYALGILGADEAQLVECALDRDPALAAQLAEYQVTADALGAVVQPVAPSPHVVERLLASVGGGRFDRFSDRVARLFDVTVDRARELLGLIERPASWVPQIPGGGPAAAAADYGFIRLAPGTMFPPHTHLGEEAVTVLAGQIQDVTNQTVCVAGDDYVQPQGSSHYLLCLGTEDCIFASRAINGIEVMGARARPIKN